MIHKRSDDAHRKRTPLRHPSSAGQAPPAFDEFVLMIPVIRRHARLRFRKLRPEEKEELVEECVANAFRAYARLRERDKQDLICASGLAKYAVKQVRDGRKVGGHLNVNDILARDAQLRRPITVERLDRFDVEEQEWLVAVIADGTTPIAEQVAFRIDFANWLQRQTRPKRRIAEALALGYTTGEAAQRFDVTPGASVSCGGSLSGPGTRIRRRGGARKGIGGGLKGSLLMPGLPRGSVVRMFASPSCIGVVEQKAAGAGALLTTGLSARITRRELVATGASLCPQSRPSFSVAPRRASVAARRRRDHGIGAMQRKFSGRGSVLEKKSIARAAAARPMRKAPPRASPQIALNPMGCRNGLRNETIETSHEFRRGAEKGGCRGEDSSLVRDVGGNRWGQRWLGGAIRHLISFTAFRPLRVSRGGRAAKARIVQQRRAALLPLPSIGVGSIPQLVPHQESETSALRVRPCALLRSCAVAGSRTTIFPRRIFLCL